MSRHPLYSLVSLLCPRETWVSRCTLYTYVLVTIKELVNNNYCVCLSSSHSIAPLSEDSASRGHGAINSLSYYCEVREMAQHYRRSAPTTTCQATALEEPTHHTCSSQSCQATNEMHIVYTHKPSSSTCPCKTSTLASRPHLLPQDAADTPRIWSHQKRPYRPDLPKISTTMEVVKVAEIPHSLQPDVDQDPTITNYKSDSTLQPQKWNSVCTFLHQRPCQRSLIARCASPRDIPRTHKWSRLLNTKISR